MEPSVPVLVDSVKTAEEFPMTRCTYFVAEWYLDQEGLGAAGKTALLRQEGGGVLFGFLSFGGVITGPLGGGRFESREQIDETFDFIEERIDWLVNSGSLWLPNRLLGKGREIGKTYRLGLDLFTAAYLHAAGRLGQAEFEEHCRKMKDQAVRSPQEEEAFTDWESFHIQAAVAIYPKNADFSLRYEE
ncbi:hypothetical protein AAU61_08240 [Desulfocarbo indianensis]|nr:hypothetical protein AAU61_08240 [Desulfocarbo indianensis]